MGLGVTDFLVCKECGVYVSAVMFDQENNERYLPYIIETSAGLNRMLLAVLSDSYWEDTENNRTVMKFDPKIAPTKAVICPLVKKDGLPEKLSLIHI